MIYLIFSIISSVLVATIIRLNESKNLNRTGVILINYLTAALLGFFLIPNLDFADHDYRFLLLCFITGSIYICTFYIYMICVRQLGLAIPVTVTRLSVVKPVLGSIFIFTEAVNLLQILGLIIAIISIYLFSWQEKFNHNKVNKISLLLPFSLFIMMGSGDFNLKIFQELFLQHGTFSFIFFVFTVSSFLSLCIVLYKKIKLDKKIIMGGILLGIPNFFSAYFILKTLQLIPGSITFPINNIGIIMLATLIGYIYWKEKLSKRNFRIL